MDNEEYLDLRDATSKNKALEKIKQLKDEGKRIVVTSGYFDPLHIGHIELFEKAKELGDHLIIVLNTNNQAMQKKGFYFMEELERAKIISRLQMVDSVILSLDSDQTQCETLRTLKPHIFAKGGDRYASEIPETPICKEHGIEIIEGLGAKIQSSSDLVKQFKEKSS